MFCFNLITISFDKKLNQLKLNLSSNLKLNKFNLKLNQMFVDLYFFNSYELTSLGSCVFKKVLIGLWKLSTSMLL